jgi:uncharacterized protein (DUF924 family)
MQALRDVLKFWFNELRERDWWEKKPTVDQKVARRFLPLHDRLHREASPYAYVTAAERLAAVIALDQFPRHLFRGDRRSFASDPLALSIALNAIDGGFDRQLDVRRRRFLYLPLEHSEDRSVQARSVQLFANLDDAEALDYAVQHKVIIDRFGRFPHRNAVLGRKSTKDEIAFLKGPKSSF